MTTHAPTHAKKHSNGTPHSVAELIEDLHVKRELTRARKAAMKFTDQAIEAGQENPKAAAAVLLGAGMVLGSLLYRLFAPRPTAAQLLARALQNRAANGLALARKLVS